MLKWDNRDETEKGFVACQEAVLGLLAQSKQVTENEIEKWLDVSLSGVDEYKHIRRHATRFAMRIAHGPLQPEK